MRRAVVWLGLLLMGALAAFLMIFSARGTASAPFADGMDWLRDAMHSSPGLSPALRSKEAVAFRALVAPYLERGMEVPRDIFESNYEALGPALMLDVLDQDRTCHVAAHELGRVIYAHEQNIVRSLAICQNTCAEGCIHGALLELYQAPDGPHDPDPSALTTEDKKKLAATCDDPAITQAMGPANCYHAVGHVIDSFTAGDTNASVGLCDSLFKARNASAAYFCATGVYMQESLAIGVDAHTMKDVESCAQSPYPAACYRFYLYGAFGSAPNPPEEARTYCDTLSGYQRLGCFNGVGAEWYSALHKKPSAVNSLCGVDDTEDVRMCLEGALQLLNVYYPGESSRVCDAYKGAADRCRDAARDRNFDIYRDLTGYIPL